MEERGGYEKRRNVYKEYKGRERGREELQYRTEFCYITVRPSVQYLWVTTCVYLV